MKITAPAALDGSLVLRVKNQKTHQREVYRSG